MHMGDGGNQARDLPVPAADREMNGGRRPRTPHVVDGVERHQQIANALEPEQQDSPNGARRGPAPAKRRQQKVGRPYEGAFAGVLDLERRQTALIVLPRRVRCPTRHAAPRAIDSRVRIGSSS